jgi:hypothetical protein
MFSSTKLAALGFCCALMAGCGGGDDGDSSGSAPTSRGAAEGSWSGYVSSSVCALGLVVLEDGSLWGICVGGGSLMDAVAGHVTANGNRLSGTILDLGPQESFTYTGSVVPQNSLNMKFASGATFSASYESSYDQPASLTALAGSYYGVTPSGKTETVTISSSGAITTSVADDCGTRGTLKPRASGKNIFDVTLNAQGGCSLAGSTAQGVAVMTIAPTDPTPTRTLWILALNTAKNDGYVFWGHAR